MRVLYGFLFAVFLAGMAGAVSPKVTTDELENGLQIVVIEDHRAPVVTHMIWYKIGSADEPRGKSGIAHFLEHLLFKGTEKFPNDTFSKTVADNGGQENAFTSYDYTAYYQRVASDRLALMMEMEADRVQNLKLGKDVIFAERDVVLEERNLRVENSPSALLSEQRMAAQYMNHGYGIPIIGWRHEIAALDVDSVLSFYKAYYAPNNAILVVAGDVDPKEVITLAKTYYGPLIRSEIIKPRVRTTEPPQLSPRRLSFADPRVRQPYVMRTYLASERNSGDQKNAAALEVLAELLGGGVTSHLSKDLQLKQKIAVDVGAFYSGLGLDKQTFGIYIVPSEGITLEDAEIAMDKSLDEFLANDLDEAHLKRIKTQILAGQIYAMDNLEGLARRYGEGLTSGLKLSDIEEWPDILSSVGIEDVKQAALELFDLRRSVTSKLEQVKEVNHD